MEKIRSKGVTFWGWVYIVFGIIGLLGAQKPQQQIEFYGPGLSIFGFVLSAANLVCGIFILKLNETARKTAIVLGIIAILLIPLYIKPMLDPRITEDYYIRRKQWIMKQVKPEFQQKALAELEQAQEASRKLLPGFLIIFMGTPLLIFDLIPIYFFTRPKVKEQFNVNKTLDEIKKA